MRPKRESNSAYQFCKNGQKHGGCGRVAGTLRHQANRQAADEVCCESWKQLEGLHLLPDQF